MITILMIMKKKMIKIIKNIFFLIINITVSVSVVAIAVIKINIKISTYCYYSSYLSLLPKYLHLHCYL